LVVWSQLGPDNEQANRAHRIAPSYSERTQLATLLEVVIAELPSRVRDLVCSMSTTPAVVRLRQISEMDVPAISELLSEGFPARSSSYWLQGLRRLAARPRVDCHPTFGYLLESGEVPVGAILLLFSKVPSANGAIVRCNVSSWYVRREFRIFASLLITATTKDASVTYFNISAVPATWSTVEAQGFSIYCRGQMYAFALLRRPIEAARIDVFDITKTNLEVPDRDVLDQHSAVGCLSLVVRCKTDSYPFVFQRHYLKRIVPIYRLTYCREVNEFVRFAGNLGRFLLGRGSVLVQLDANEFVSGLAGWYTEKRGRKYSKGPHAPRLGDLSFTETAFFDS
jgi:hypothetical protein